MASDLQRWCEPGVILVATNLNDQPSLMRYAANEARRSGARLLLVHVVPPPRVTEESAAGGHPHLFRLPSTHRAADVLDHIALQLQWQGVLCEPIVLTGDPGKQILLLVRSRPVDQVIVADRNNPRHEASLTRSVAENLITSLPLPVCVISRQTHPEAVHSTATERILLALSLHSASQEYVDYACGVARARRARLTLLHVVDPARVAERQMARAHDTARLQLAALAATHEGLLWRPDIVVRQGDPASQILEEAACPFRDSIILGSSAVTSTQAEHRADVIHRVISETRCPVIALKPSSSATRSELILAYSELKTGS